MVKKAAPHNSHSPSKHCAQWNSASSTFGQSIDSHIAVTPANWLCPRQQFPPLRTPHNTQGHSHGTKKCAAVRGSQKAFRASNKNSTYTWYRQQHTLHCLHLITKKAQTIEGSIHEDASGWAAMKRQYKCACTIAKDEISVCWNVEPYTLDVHKDTH